MDNATPLVYLDWPDTKAKIDSIKTNYDWVESDSRHTYTIYVNGHIITYSCTIYTYETEEEFSAANIVGITWADNQAWRTEFEANYKNVITLDSIDGLRAINVSVYNPERQYEGKSYKFNAIGNTTNIHDVQIDADMTGADGYIAFYGGGYKINGAVNDGDYVELAIVDKDDVLGLFGLYGLTVGVDVLEIKKFEQTHYVVDNDRTEITSSQCSLIPQGLYLRFIYESVGALEPSVIVKYMKAK
jgi:hypothetical protein